MRSSALAGSPSRPQAALLSGILLGDDSGLPETAAAAFKMTGMIYIIAISGQTRAMVKCVIHPDRFNPGI